MPQKKINKINHLSYVNLHVVSMATLRIGKMLVFMSKVHATGIFRNNPAYFDISEKKFLTDIYLVKLSTIYRIKL